mgnify:CR=1 FL=1
MEHNIIFDSRRVDKVSAQKIKEIRISRIEAYKKSNDVVEHFNGEESTRKAYADEGKQLLEHACILR